MKMKRIIGYTKRMLYLLLLLVGLFTITMSIVIIDYTSLPLTGIVGILIGGIMSAIACQKLLPTNNNPDN